MYLRYGLAAAVLPALGYLDYVVCYIAGYDSISKHQSKKAAIALYVLLGYFQLLVLWYWLLIHLRGPGFSKVDLPLQQNFPCDAAGFPYWCLLCQKPKQPRTSHVAILNKCVFRFDHNCVWVASTIGRRNFLPFLKYLFAFGCHFALVLVFLLYTVKTSYRFSHNNVGHFVPVYFFSVSFFLMIFTLFVAQLYYLRRNFTTIDVLSLRLTRGLFGRPPRHTFQLYMNVEYKGSRFVVPFSPQNEPYSMGFKKNFIDVVLNGSVAQNAPARGMDFAKALVVFLVPFVDIFVSTKQELDDFSPKFLQMLYDKIEAGDCVAPTFKEELNVTPSKEQHPTPEPNP